MIWCYKIFKMLSVFKKVSTHYLHENQEARASNIGYKCNKICILESLSFEVTLPPRVPKQATNHTFEHNKLWDVQLNIIYPYVIQTCKWYNKGFSIWTCNLKRNNMMHLLELKAIYLSKLKKLIHYLLEGVEEFKMGCKMVPC